MEAISRWLVKRGVVSVAEVLVEHFVGKPLEAAAPLPHKVINQARAPVYSEVGL